ncbi:hypothetical protein [Oceanicoccus sagamiensis]|uniref:Uncharacterized protein n=1 Tax=Oceanicoccus sagamiensis TaxID=716816 RepID=A0A1X9NGD1_9GAMM|nr:hypothetical protein [Oceanicoccus sagamiensis]ARN74007.1 hypothetical protein BST96_07670 [Oceanicoccus sagamiensis]
MTKMVLILLPLIVFSLNSYSQTENKTPYFITCWAGEKVIVSEGLSRLPIQRSISGVTWMELELDSGVVYLSKATACQMTINTVGDDMIDTSDSKKIMDFLNRAGQPQTGSSQGDK